MFSIHTFKPSEKAIENTFYREHIRPGLRCMYTVVLKKRKKVLCMVHVHSSAVHGVKALYTMRSLSKEEKIHSLSICSLVAGFPYRMCSLSKEEKIHSLSIWPLWDDA